MFLQLFNSTNLVAVEMREAFPWDFNPTPEMLEKMRSLPKDQRRDLVGKEDTAWNVYSTVRGVTRRARVGKDNPPAAIRGIVADYDLPTSPEQVTTLLAKIKRPEFMPNYVERSLSNNVRLVWLFEREVLVPDESFARRLLETFLDKLGAPSALAGYDKKSAQPQQVWTNGSEWSCVKATPMPWPTVFGIVCEVGSKVEWGSAEIPYEVIYAELDKRWPGRWRGPFDLDKTGVRFWDDKADNPCGCQVKPDGMLCFTGPVGFRKWEQIFGAEWCDSQRAINLGKAAGDTYFDGRAYWQQQADRWYPVSREDVVLSLKLKEIPTKAKRGRVSSDIERVLGYIQKINRVDGAAPIVNRKPGLTMLDGNRILNTSTIQAMKPAEIKGVTIEMIPYLWDYYTGLFECQHMGSLDHWLAWIKRYYISVLEYRPLMGQAVFLCGPKGNGKTLLGYRVIKPLVGDKSANPYDYFTGQTTFNSELFESPLLMINDEEAINNPHTKSKFMARLKSFVVNPAHMYHKKFGTPCSTEWTGRLFSTLNDDPSSVGLLPEVNENTRDKIMFFKSKERATPWEDNHVVEAKIAAELPLFARFLLEYQPPPEIQIGGRMGVRSFFDPDILSKSVQQNAHYHMREVIAHWIKECRYWAEDQKKATWQGNPTEFFAEVSGYEEMKIVMQEWTSAKCAHALNTLARIRGSGVEYVPNSDRNFKITRSVVMHENNPAAPPKDEPADL